MRKFSGSKMENLRARRKFRRADLAWWAGVSERSILNYETGATVPDVNRAYRIAAALGTTLNRLTEDDK